MSILSVLWLILKILGIVLLALLGIAILVLAAVAFVPVRYRIQVSFYGHLQAEVRIAWLLHILSCRLCYGDSMDMSFRILGYPISKGFRDHESEKGEDTEEDFLVTAQGLETEPDSKEYHTGESFGESGENFWYEGTEADGNLDLQEQPETQNEHSQKKHSRAHRNRTKPAGRKKRMNPLHQLRLALQKMYDKLKDITTNIEKVSSWIGDEENKQAFRLFFGEGKAVMRHILPRRGKGKLTVGFDDPYTTGQFLSAAGILYPVYRERIQIYPVFDQSVLEGEFWVKGRIRASNLLWSGFKLWRNKKIRKIIRR